MLSVANCMESEPQNLEKELEKPDWKQWIPVYGLSRIYRAEIDGAPSISDENYPIRCSGSCAYHGITAATAIVGTMYGLTQLVEKLF